MDNLKYYNDSLAYDFEMFAPRPVRKAQPQDNIVVMPKKAASVKKRRAGAARRLSAPVTIIAIVFIALSALCGNIALRLQINEVTSKINDVKDSISELQSEKTSLEVELQRRISFANLELEAVQLGMKKPEKEDVTYIRVNDKNAAVTKNGTFVSEE